MTTRLRRGQPKQTASWDPYRAGLRRRCCVVLRCPVLVLSCWISGIRLNPILLQQSPLSFQHSQTTPCFSKRNKLRRGNCRRQRSHRSAETRSTVAESRGGRPLEPLLHDHYLRPRSAVVRPEFVRSELIKT